MEQLTQVNSSGKDASWGGGGAHDLGGLAGYTIRHCSGRMRLVLKEYNTARGAERVRHRQPVSEKSSHLPMLNEFPGWLRPYCNMCWDQWMWLPTCLNQGPRMTCRGEGGSVR